MGYVVVTGACGGIGKAVVDSLLRNKREVVAVDIDYNKLQETFQENEKLMLLACDLMEEENIVSMLKIVVSTTGPIAGLVHCAGFDKLSPLYLNKREDIQRLLSIHLLAAMDMCKFLAKKGNAVSGCSIVLISSLSAHEGAKGHTAYAAAKGAVEGFLASASAELVEKGIRINELILGVVQTEMSMGFVGKMDSTQRALLDASYPLGLGMPEDVAGMIRFLLDAEAGWITGQKFVLDGGHSVRKV